MSITDCGGEEADRDGDFSIKISEALGVPCHMIKAEVKKYATQTGMSEEEAGRIRVIKPWRKKQGPGKEKTVRQ